MYNVCEDNREEIENEFIALILHKPELIAMLQITPKMLKFKKNKIMLQCANDCYSKFGYIDLTQMVEMYPKLNIDYFVELFCDTMWYPNAWKEQFDTAQHSILQFYKNDVVDFLNEEFKNKKISSENYFEKIKKIDELQLDSDTNELTKEEMIDCINEEKARINLNKFEKLNNTLKLVQGDFLIIGATTGAGKSGLMLNLMSDLMNTYQCIYFNMEMSKATIYKRIVSINADLKIVDVEHPRTEYQRQLIDAAMDKIEAAKLIVEHKAIDMQAIKNVVARKKEKDKHTIIFIDHIGLIKIENSKSLYEQATEVAKQLRQLCLDYDCTIVCASQLNRGAYGNEKISLSMLKDSGELENSASKVMLLYKGKDAKPEDIETEMVFEVAKNRDGITGTIKSIYKKDKQIFEEKSY